MTPAANDMLSIIVPLFNEELNIDRLVQRLLNLKNKLAATVRIEVILVDDGSRDQTFAKACTAVSQHKFIRAIQLSKNSGSHAAIAAGLSECSGDCAVFLAGDLQDPPELILQMLEKWRTGSKVVWANKVKVDGKKVVDSWFSSLYWRLFVAVNEVSMPPGGADFALIDKKVVDAIRPRLQKPIAIFTLIAQTGYTPTVVFYEKECRGGGSSGWTFKKKLGLILDSVIIPAKSLRIVAAISVVVYAALLVSVPILLLAAPSALVAPSATAVLLAVFITVAILQMVALAIVGEYLYSIVLQSYETPRFLIAERISAGTALADTATDPIVVAPATASAAIH
jgi:glycosyltransferase involved in cell wall biosynthesis